MFFNFLHSFVGDYQGQEVMIVAHHSSHKSYYEFEGNGGRKTRMLESFFQDCKKKGVLFMLLHHVDI